MSVTNEIILNLKINISYIMHYRKYYFYSTYFTITVFTSIKPNMQQVSGIQQTATNKIYLNK